MLREHRGLAQGLLFKGIVWQLYFTTENPPDPWSRDTAFSWTDDNVIQHSSGTYSRCHTARTQNIPLLIAKPP